MTICDKISEIKYKHKFCSWQFIFSQLTKDEINYFINRFNDSESYNETYYRLLHNIEYRPLCIICNKPVKFVRNNFQKYCSCKCAQQDNKVRQKQEQTNIKKFGKTNAAKSLNIKEKTKQICIEKYGIDNPNKLPSIKDKKKQTCLEKYGVDNPAKSTNVKEKIKQTCLIKYGYVSNLCTSEIINKNKSDTVRNKQYETKKKNKSFNTSKSEDKCYELLKSKFSVVLRQYKSEKYPFSCDFYIPDKDLYIEYNGTWTHGNHLFNKTNKDDISKLNEWKEKSKKSRYYKNAIYTWTDLDVRKYNTAKQNNLNYIIVWNLNDFANIIKK